MVVKRGKYGTGKVESKMKNDFGRAETIGEISRKVLYGMGMLVEWRI